jgi:hypothetical protein
MTRLEHAWSTPGHDFNPVLVARNGPFQGVMRDSTPNLHARVINLNLDGSTEIEKKGRFESGMDLG